MAAVLESPDVRLLVLGRQLHLLAEPALDVARVRVDALLSALRDLVTTLLVAVHLRQLQRLLRLHTASSLDVAR